MLWSVTYFAYVCTQVLIVKNKRDITNLLRNIQDCIAPHLATKLNRVWRWSLVIVFAYYILGVAFNMLEYYEQKSMKTLTNAFMHFDVSSSVISFHLIFAIRVLYGNTWLFVLFVIYNYVLTSIDYVHISYFNHELSLNESVQSLRQLWLKVTEVHDTFEHLLSFVPGVLFASLFMRTMTYIAGLRETQLRFNLLTVLLIYFFVSKLTYCVWIVFKISYTNNHLNRMFRRFQETSINRNSFDLELLRQDIAATLHVNFTGSGLFTLNKELLLSFASAIVSFTILYLQLTQ